MAAAIFVFAAVNHRQIAASVAAADAESRRAERETTAALHARRSRTGDAGQRVNIRRKITPDVRQVLNLFALDGVGLLCALDFNQRCCVRDGDFRRHGGDLHLEFDRDDLSDGQLNLFDDLLGKALCLDGQFVRTGTQRQKGEFAAGIALHNAGSALIAAFDRECGVGNRAAL